MKKWNTYNKKYFKYKNIKYKALD